MADNILELNDQNFEDTISSGVTLVDFYAVWCGPCKMMTPVIEEIATEFSGKAKVGKLDIEQAQHTASKFQVTSIPTIIVFKDGKQVDTVIGLQNHTNLKTLLESHL